MKKEQHNNRHETQRDFLTEEEVQSLIQEFGLKEEGPSLVLETKNEKGKSVRYFFPKLRRYQRSEEAGGGWIVLREDIIRKKKELSL